MIVPKGFCAFAAFVVVVNVLTPANTAASRNFRQQLRKLFKCPACDPLSCPIAEGYPECELVLETGVCACCQVCARQAGELCGLPVGSGRCGKGLTCRAMPGQADHISAILSGNAICM